MALRDMERKAKPLVDLIKRLESDALVQTKQIARIEAKVKASKTSYLRLSVNWQCACKPQISTATRLESTTRHSDSYEVPTRAFEKTTMITRKRYTWPDTKK